MTADQPFFDAVDGIRSDAVMLAEVTAKLPMLEAAARPSGAAGVQAALLPLIVVYGVSDRSEAEWATFWQAYAEDLAEYPDWAVLAGVRRYRRMRDANWFPKPGPLRALIEEEARPVLMALSRARRVVAQ